MKKAALFSALLHGFIFILLAIGLPDFKKNRDDLWVPIPVDILEVAEVTQSPAPMPAPAPEEKKPDPKKEPEKTKSEPIKEDSPAPRPEPEPEPELPPAPEPPAKEPEPELPPLPEPPVKEPDPPNKPVEERAVPKPEKAPPKPKAKPRPPTKKEAPKKKIEKKKPEDDFESVLKDLTDIKKEVEKKDVQDSASTSINQSVGKLGPAVTVSELDALRRHLRPCWNLPAGAKDGRQLVVEVRVYMNPDGTVRDARLLSPPKSSQNPFYRTAAESALRAVKDSRCQPFPLPKQKYDQWKVFVINFNPKDLL